MAIINGTDYNDTLIGSSDNDFISAGHGTDIIDGGNGSDYIFGGSHKDYIFAGEGDDVVVGDALLFGPSGPRGNDVVFGGGGADTLFGDAGNDRLSGDVGDDTLEGGTGNDQLYGGAGVDSLIGGGGYDRLFGGDDGDLMRGAGVLAGGHGDDHIWGLEGSVVYGGAGYDTCYADSGAVRIAYNVLDDAPPMPGPGVRLEGIIGFDGRAGDRIDVSLIDAKAAVAGDQAFVFVGFNAVDQPGEIGLARGGRVGHGGAPLLFIVAETDGVDGFDLRIQVDAINPVIAADFLL